jgi:hypothetical protein
LLPSRVKTSLIPPNFRQSPYDFPDWRAKRGIPPFFANGSRALTHH